TIYFERLLAPMLLGRPTDSAIVDKAIVEDLPSVYSYLEGEIAARSYLAGGQFTIADAATAAFFYCMRVADAAPDAKRWPNLARYIQVQHSRPAIAALIAQIE